MSSLSLRRGGEVKPYSCLDFRKIHRFGRDHDLARKLNCEKDSFSNRSPVKLRMTNLVRRLIAKE